MTKKQRAKSCELLDHFRATLYTETLLRAIITCLRDDPQPDDLADGVEREQALRDLARLLDQVSLEVSFGRAGRDLLRPGADFHQSGPVGHLRSAAGPERTARAAGPVPPLGTRLVVGWQATPRPPGLGDRDSRVQRARPTEPEDRHCGGGRGGGSMTPGLDRRDPLGAALARLLAEALVAGFRASTDVAPTGFEPVLQSRLPFDRWGGRAHPAHPGRTMRERRFVRPCARAGT